MTHVTRFLNSSQEAVRFVSDYFATLLQRPEYRQWLFEDDHLSRRYPLASMYSEVKEEAVRTSDLQELLACLRVCKQKHFLRIGARDLLLLSDFRETVSQLTDFAEVCLQVGFEILASRPQWWLQRHQCSIWNTFWEHCQCVIMGLGKLGGRELNFVSDVDLVIFHQLAGENLDIQEQGRSLLRKYAQELSGLIGKSFLGDFVFQVDFRLRPQGKDGELVSSLEGALDHYQLRGQAWERQALLKARPVAGVRTLGSVFLQELHSFVFRRFLDFQSLDEMRQMRDRILFEAKQQQNRVQSFDLKLGIGGIREIEFFVQSFQLIYGGRYPALEEPNTLRCLDVIRKMQLLESAVVDELQEAYIFLRRAEHWIQLDHNRRGTRLPVATKGKEKLAWALGFSGQVKAFEEALFAHTAKVHRHFASLFAPRKLQDQSKGAVSGAAEDRHGSELTGSICPEARQYLATIQEVTRDFGLDIETILCQVIDKYTSLPQEDLTQRTGRVFHFFRQLATRPGLKRVVLNHGLWLNKVIHGLIQSAFVANLLVHQPGIIEGVYEETLPGDASGTRLVCHEHTRECRGSYSEETFERIRRWKNEQMLKYALQEIMNEISESDLNRALSEVADSVLCWTYDSLTSLVDNKEPLSLSIVGLGKLGSQEMGFLSDLDLMFVFDPGEGDRYGIPAPVLSLCQRLIRLLTIPLQEGPGYPVDIQIRPTGNYGPLIVTKARWTEYYRHQADLWEIQALLRSRALTGDMTLGQELQKSVQNICFQPRDPGQVWSRICQLRHRMETERGGEKEGSIHLKVGFGGLADLEFLVQGCQLIYGHDIRSLQGRNTLEMLPAALELLGIQQEARDFAFKAFVTLRSLERRLHLMTNDSQSKLSPQALTLLGKLGLWPFPERSGVFPVSSWEEVLTIRRRIRQIWESVCSDSFSKDGSSHDDHLE